MATYTALIISISLMFANCISVRETVGQDSTLKKSRRANMLLAASSVTTRDDVAFFVGNASFAISDELSVKADTIIWNRIDKTIIARNLYYLKSSSKIRITGFGNSLKYYINQKSLLLSN